LELIVGHLNTDFDALASMVAARKLYPQANMVFPGSMNRNVREYMALHGDMFDFRDLHSLDLETVTRLIVVDTRQADRLGELQWLARKKSVEVFVFDHHPPSRKDIRCANAVVEKVGATVTILLKLLRGREAEIQPYEATLFALGIHEDTGSLTFAGTTPDDAEALASLMRLGASPSSISLFLNRTLSPEQHRLLNELLANFRYHDIKGIRVVTSHADAGGFVEGASAAVSRLVELENLDVFFAFIRQGDRLTVMSHSRIAAVRADRVLGDLGGGGHAEAASATLRGVGPGEAEELLLEALRRRVRVDMTAGKIMTSKVRTVNEDLTISETSRRMERTGHTAFPVVDVNGRLVGMISRKDLDRAGHHGLGHAPVKGFMSRHLVTVTPETPLQELHALMTENAIGRLPVVEEGRIVGIVTRKDLLRAMQGAEYLQRTEPGRQAPDSQLADLLYRSLPREAREVLQRASSLAEKYGYRVYLVGGVVRDMLLGVKNLDLDLVVEGRGIEFARRLGKELGARVRTHGKFGTANLILPDGRHVDVATARTEYYPFPAALPQVEEASIRQDLFRRDFSINSMAVSLHPESHGELLDFFGGRRDLQRGQIRVLHNLSFVEDPTRIFRAVRLESRYGFRMEPQTEALARRAVDMEFVGELSGSRVRDELYAIMEDRDPLQAVKRLQDLGALARIHGRLRCDQAMERRFRRLERHLPAFLKLVEDDDAGGVEAGFQRRLPFLAALLEGLDPAEAQAWAERMRMKRKETLVVLECLGWRGRKRAIEEGGQDLSACYRETGSLSKEGASYLYCQGGSRIRALMGLYYTKLRSNPMLVTGRDLERLGVRPSPAFSAILGEVRLAALEGRALDRRTQLALARRLAENAPSQERGSGGKK